MLLSQLSWYGRRELCRALSLFLCLTIVVVSEAFADTGGCYPAEPDTAQTSISTGDPYGTRRTTSSPSAITFAGTPQGTPAQWIRLFGNTSQDPQVLRRLAHFVIIADGFNSANTARQRAEQLFFWFRDRQPFVAYRNLFTVWVVYRPASNQVGSSGVPGPSNTGVLYVTGASGTPLIAPHRQKTDAFIAGLTPPFPAEAARHYFVLFNQPLYGGSGGPRYGLCLLGAAAQHIPQAVLCLHEWLHTSPWKFFDLYPNTFQTTSGPNSSNFTIDQQIAAGDTLGWGPLKGVVPPVSAGLLRETINSFPFQSGSTRRYAPTAFDIMGDTQGLSRPTDAKFSLQGAGTWLRYFLPFLRGHTPEGTAFVQAVYPPLESGTVVLNLTSGSSGAQFRVTPLITDSAGAPSYRFSPAIQWRWNDRIIEGETGWQLSNQGLLRHLQRYNPFGGSAIGQLSMTVADTAAFHFYTAIKGYRDDENLDRLYWYSVRVTFPASSSPPPPGATATQTPRPTSSPAAPTPTRTPAPTFTPRPPFIPSPAPTATPHFGTPVTVTLTCQSCGGRPITVRIHRIDPCNDYGSTMRCATWVEVIGADCLNPQQRLLLEQLLAGEFQKGAGTLGICELVTRSLAMAPCCGGSQPPGTIRPPLLSPPTWPSMAPPQSPPPGFRPVK